MLHASVPTTPFITSTDAATHGYHALRSRPTLCFHNLEGKPGLVALFELHVHFFVRDDHLVLQVPSGAPTEFRDDGVAIAEEIDVEVGVVAWLGRGELLVWGGSDGGLPLWRCILAARDGGALLRLQTRALLSVKFR